MDGRRFNSINLKTSTPILFFFSLIVIYFLQGSLYPSGSIVSQGALVISILFNSYYFVKVVISKNKLSFIKWWSIFIAFIVCGFVLTGEYTNPLFVSQLKNILYFMTGFYPIYYWTSNGLLTGNHLRNLLLVLLPVFIVSFFTSQVTLQIEQNRENVVNNASYMFVSLLPFLFFIKNRIITLMIIIIILGFLVIGSKRGALVIGLLSSGLILYFNLKHIQGKNIISKFRNVLIIGVILSVGFFYLSDVIESNYYVFDRLERNESTRPENYLALWNNWYNSSSFVNLLFGYGYFSSPLYTPEEVMAHNDWLEMLNDFGLFGLVIYILLLISFAKLIKKQQTIELKYTHILVLLIWVFISFFSMWMNNYANVMYAILIGYLIGVNNLNYSKLSISKNNEKKNSFHTSSS